MKKVKLAPIPCFSRVASQNKSAQELRIIHVAPVVNLETKEKPI